MDLIGFRGAPAQLVQGNPAAVQDENFRYKFPTEEAARYYLAEPFPEILDLPRGVPLFFVIWCITRQATGVTRWTKRRSLSESPTTRKNYLASGRAKEEARLNGVSTTEEWYQVAPDLLAFRRKAPARQFSQIWYCTYIRGSDVLAATPEQIAEAEAGLARLKRRAKRDLDPRQMSFGL